jgi:Kef-type K+ transport system membrane component KefB
MNNLDCNVKTFIEAIFVGFICLVIGRIAFYLSTNKNDRKKKEEIKKFNLIFFAIGFCLHFIIEFIGLNKWYCDKKCMSNLKLVSRI